MEGAAVAQVASQHRLPFFAVKAVSDNLEFDLPPLNAFVDAKGRFQMGRFVAWAAIRPQWWGKIAELKRISDAAARSLAALLDSIIRNNGLPGRAMISGSPLTTHHGD
jgi:adenosylhomocysteine nucleosidase